LEKWFHAMVAQSTWQECPPLERLQSSASHEVAPNGCVVSSADIICASIHPEASEALSSAFPLG
jgi:hypothetical protein